MIGSAEWAEYRHQCPRCPKKVVFAGSRRRTEAPTQFCTGTFDQPHRRCAMELSVINLLPEDHSTCPVLQRAEDMWHNKYERPGRHEYNRGDTLVLIDRSPDRVHKVETRIIDIDDDTGDILVEPMRYSSNSLRDPISFQVDAEA